MADNTKPKAGGKAGEKTLGILGAVLNMAGPILGIPGLNLGAPFDVAAQGMAQKREQNNLIQLLSTTPETAPLVQGGQMLADSGGLVNQPDVQNALGVGQQAAPPPVDYTSPEFISRASVLAPGLAQALTLKKAGQADQNPIDDILKMLKLQHFQTPAMLREARLEDRTSMLEATSKMIEGRTEKTARIKQQIKAETFTPKETEKYNKKLTSIAKGKELLRRINSGLNPSLLVAGAATSELGSVIAQRYAPEQMEMLQTIRDLKRMVQEYVKDSSGVQYGFRELTWLKTIMPSAFDTPEMLNITLRKLNTQMAWANFIPIMTKVEEAGNFKPAFKRGMSFEQIKAYKRINDQLNAQLETKKGDAKSIFSDPNNAADLKLLKLTDMLE